MLIFSVTGRVSANTERCIYGSIRHVSKVAAAVVVCAPLFLEKIDSDISPRVTHVLSGL